MKNPSKRLLVVRSMPPLYHTIPAKVFDVENSQVIEWLIRQPEILNWLWDQIKQSGLVEYDPKSRKWKGVDS